MIGTVVDDKYWIVSELGVGGAGTVYKAEQRELNRLVAIKILHAKNAADQQLFKEAKNLLKVRSPHIVNVIAVGMINNEQPYLVMEYLDGESLDKIIASSGPLSQSQTVDIGIQICLALEAAHKEKMVHRDLKPANIMLAKGTERSVAKVLDFGLAKNLNPGESMAATATKTGNLVGTVAYMSPEVCSGQKADLLSDIYSFGCILYECLAGHPPFQTNDNWVALLHMHQYVEAAPLRDEHPEINPEMELLILKCLQKNPSNRFQSPLELRTALELIQSGRLQELATSGMLKLERQARKKQDNFPKLLPVIAALIILFAGAALLRTSMKRPSSDDTLKKPALPKTEKKIKLNSLAQRLAELPKIEEKSEDDQSVIPTALGEIEAINEKSTDPRVLAVTYQLKGKLMEKEQHYNEAIESFKQAYGYATKCFSGKDSVESLNSLLGQFHAQLESKQDAAAEQTIKKILPLMREVDEGELPSVKLAISEEKHYRLYIWTEASFQTYDAYAALLTRKHDYPGAIKAAKKAMEVSTYLRPEPYIQLATIAMEQGKKQEAEHWMKELEKKTNLLADDVRERKNNLAGQPSYEHVTNAAKCFHQIAGWYRGQARYEEAKHYYQQVVEMAEGSNYYGKMGSITDAKTGIKEMDRLIAAGKSR